MRRDLHDQTHAVEDWHWWYVGRRRIIERAIKDSFDLGVTLDVIEHLDDEGALRERAARSGPVARCW